MFKVKFAGGPLGGETHDTAVQPASGFWIGISHNGRREWTLYLVVHRYGHCLLAEADKQVAVEG
ncbi:hypothetical protein AB0F71_25375 [Kitasatospora sp. NPDC028055]|uniref:hypothetical protein n=1 Tax=Kitasatospora sp. NPDC028055 TaxID=3155653 RepID=UPI0033D73E7C